MSGIAKPAFRKAILLSKLLSQEQLDREVAELRAPIGGGTTAVAIDDTILAERLVTKGLLTAYQVQQLQLGRTKFDLGPYIIIDFIGQGGMGQVFRGRHRVMERECAVKVLPLTKVAATPDAFNNFLREVKTLAQMDHPNIVRAFDANKEGDVPYLVTEYVPGTDLRRLVRSNGRLSQQEAASIISQTAKALHYAHKRGIIHRDVKPGNVLVTPEGISKLTDVGLSLAIQESENDPRRGRIVGTPDYLAPELIRSSGEDFSAASDVYALGCTLYYCVCGKVPFPGGSTRDKARRHLDDTPWHPTRFSPQLDAEFVELIGDMMEKDPSRRVQSAEEVAHRLEPWASDGAMNFSKQMPKARWSAAPPPTEELIEPPVVDLDGEYPAGNPGGSSVSLFGQETATSSSSGSRLLPFPILPMNLVTDETPPSTIVAVTLAIAVPISMFLGAVLATALMSLIR